MKNEIWKDLVGYEGLYQVSNLGNIKRSYLLKPHLDRKGYYFVNLSKNGVVKCCRVHRLIAITFLPNDEGKTEVNHINGIKTDNRVSNLEWTSHKENMKHAYDNNLINKKVLFDNINKMTSESEKAILQYKNGVLIKEYESYSSAKRETKISHISCCANGKRKTAGGFEWKYK